MSPAILLAALLAAPAATPAPVATAPTQSTDVTAHWLVRPTGQTIATFSPPLAASRGADGGAILRCTVNANHHLEQCSVIFEAPEGLGFGEAALKLSKVFRIAVEMPMGSTVRPTTTVPMEWIFGQQKYGPKAFLITHPRWITAPGFADVEKAYLSSAEGAVGALTLRCRVNSAGRIGLCRNQALPPEKGPSQTPAVRLTTVARNLTDKFQMIIDPAGFPVGTPLMTDVTFNFVAPSDPTFTGRQISDPAWIATIAPGAAEKLFPPEAAAKGLKTGRGVAECTVGADGSLQTCHPLAGDPDGMGFSEAAVKVASVMRMSLWTNAGGPVVGATVRLPIRFNLAAPAAGEPSKP